ncbi:MAG: protein-glutamate O-methyltransferase [Hyphomicrobiales bacterium]|nr:protein-glutamate O-methyltransferase [Hyphomicrobiales bacterium]
MQNFATIATKKIDAEIDSADFSAIARLLHETSGIRLADSKKAMVYARLAKRARALGMPTLHEYCRFVISDEGVSERSEMISAMTTNVTRFFRESHHFEHLTAMLKGTTPDAGPIRLWSAGCSTGQEPYSIACAVLSAIPDAARRNIKILATDIDQAVLAKADSGLYSDEEIAGLPPEARNRWFSKDGAGWRVGPELKGLIAFRKLNLVGAWPMSGRFDAIFCRNVAIYFDAPTQAELWSRMMHQLKPHGHLYIGHSERIPTPLRAAFEIVGVTIYRRNTENAS